MVLTPKRMQEKDNSEISEISDIFRHIRKCANNFVNYSHYIKSVSLSTYLLPLVE
jgi:hypothetical protein